MHVFQKIGHQTLLTETLQTKIIMCNTPCEVSIFTCLQFSDVDHTICVFLVSILAILFLIISYLLKKKGVSKTLGYTHIR